MGRVGAAVLALWFVVSTLARAATPQLADLLRRYDSEPDNSVLCEQIGVAYTQEGNLDRAVVFFGRAVELDPPRVSARKNLATVLWFSGQKTRSESLFTVLEKQIPHDPVPQLYLGLAAYDRKEFEMAAHHFDRAGDLARTDPETLPAVAEAYLSVGRFGRAREALSAQLKQQPGSAKVLFELGLSYALEGNFAEGRATFVQAGNAEPHWSLPLMALGVVDLQTGHADQAAEDFQKAMSFAPGDYRPHYFRAMALKHSEAISQPATRSEELSELRRAVALDSSQENAWVGLGEAEIAAGHDAEGESDLRRALQLDPKEPGALYKLALLCRREGRAQESEALLRAFRESKQKARQDEDELASLLRTAR